MNEDLVGKMVRGPSGRHLGRIIDATAKRICVEIEGAPAWLPRDVIFSEEEEHVTVIFEPQAVGRYVVAGIEADRTG